MLQLSITMKMGLRLELEFDLPMFGESELDRCRGG